MSTLTEIANKLIEETDCSTDQALEVLEESGGDYEKALELLKKKGKTVNSSKQKESTHGAEEEQYEQEYEQEYEEEYKVKGKDIFEAIKKILKEGNVAKISIKKDGETILNIPVNAAAIGLIWLPFASMIAGIAALATDCTIQVQRRGDVVVDVNEKLKKAGNKMEDVINNILKQ